MKNYPYSIYNKPSHYFIFDNCSNISILPIILIKTHQIISIIDCSNSTHKIVPIKSPTGYLMIEKTNNNYFTIIRLCILTLKQVKLDNLIVR